MVPFYAAQMPCTYVYPNIFSFGNKFYCLFFYLLIFLNCILYIGCTVAARDDTSFIVIAICFCVDI